MRFEIIERHIIDVPDSELTDDERPLGKMTLAEVLDAAYRYKVAQLEG